MDEADDDVKSLNIGDEGPGLLEYGILAAGAAPWAFLGGVLLSARDPSNSVLGFSGYVSNPTAGQAQQGPGGPGAPNPFVAGDQACLFVPPLPGPTSMNIIGNGFVPYEFVALLNDGVQFDQVQADVNGAFTYPWSPNPLTGEGHTVTAVDLDYGVRVSFTWFGCFANRMGRVCQC